MSLSAAPCHVRSEDGHGWFGLAIKAAAVYESAQMLVAIFRRRLKEGATFEDFIAAWEADKGFGVPARVFNSVSLEDPREILSVGFVDIDAEAFEQATAGVVDQEEVRHARIDDVIESTELRAFYDLRTEHDFSDEPRAIDLASAASLLAGLRPPSS